MLDVVVLCIIVAYAVAFGLEVARVLGKETHFGWRIGFLGAAFLTHTASGAYRIILGLEQAQGGGPPLSLRQDWYFTIAWGLALVCLLWMIYRPGNPFGVFFLPVIVILMGLGWLWRDPVPFVQTAASRIWGLTHGISILLAMLAVCIAILTGLMYLGQVYRLKRRRLGSSAFRLPSLEWLQKANTHALGFALVMLALGIFSGLLLNATERTTPQGPLPWNDPVVVSTWILFLWLAGSLCVGWIYRPLREGRRVVYLTIVSFVFMLLVLGMTLFGTTQHGRSTHPRDVTVHGARNSCCAAATGGPRSVVAACFFAENADGREGPRPSMFSAPCEQLPRDLPRKPGEEAKQPPGPLPEIHRAVGINPV